MKTTESKLADRLRSIDPDDPVASLYAEIELFLGAPWRESPTRRLVSLSCALIGLGIDPINLLKERLAEEVGGGKPGRIGSGRTPEKTVRSLKAWALHGQIKAAIAQSKRDNSIEKVLAAIHRTRLSQIQRCSVSGSFLLGFGSVWTEADIAGPKEFEQKIKAAATESEEALARQLALARAHQTLSVWRERPYAAVLGKIRTSTNRYLDPIELVREILPDLPMDDEVNENALGQRFKDAKRRFERRRAKPFGDVAELLNPFTDLAAPIAEFDRFWRERFEGREEPSE